MLEAAGQAFCVCPDKAALGERRIPWGSHFESIQCRPSCRCARDAPKYDAVGARQASDAIGAVHTACCLATGVEALNARVRGLVDLDTAVGSVGIHRHTHFINRGDAVLVLQPGGKGLHKLWDILAGEVVVECQALCTCLIDGKINGAGSQARSEGAISGALLKQIVQLVVGDIDRLVYMYVAPGLLVKDKVALGLDKARHHLHELYISKRCAVHQRDGLRGAEHVGGSEAALE